MKQPAAPAIDRHITNKASPRGPGRNAQEPSTMPRAEDDAATHAASHEFRDRPGSGKHIGDRKKVF
jgi:hypothetical protein